MARLIDLHHDFNPGGIGKARGQRHGIAPGGPLRDGKDYIAPSGDRRAGILCAGEGVADLLPGFLVDCRGPILELAQLLRCRGLSRRWLGRHRRMLRLRRNRRSGRHGKQDRKDQQWTQKD